MSTGLRSPLSGNRSHHFTTSTPHQRRNPGSVEANFQDLGLLGHKHPKRHAKTKRSVEFTAAGDHSTHCTCSLRPV
ncbi:hypothetical protein GQ44DRAFT_708909 [Phaeosphaeriaceae sp. PMI808]|nr:hypothetical protein GQ44DRAFT_708909 [Phaeosphaeriaceae sp. PMI808]